MNQADVSHPFESELCFWGIGFSAFDWVVGRDPRPAPWRATDSSALTRRVTIQCAVQLDTLAGEGFQLYRCRRNSKMESNYVRSPELMHVADTVLMVIDVQEKLMPHIANRPVVEENIARLVKVANAAELPVICTEQYPKGLGRTVASIADEVTEAIEKITFSCVGVGQCRDRLQRVERRKVLLCGVESHVCVLQTAFDLMADGYTVFLAADAVSSRSEFDHATAVRRMEASGVSVTSTEAAIFEWCERAGTELFKQVRAFIS